METKTLDMDKLNRVNHLAGELRILAARLAAARVRVILAGLLLALTIPLEWALGVDFFAEFARNEVGEIASMDMVIVAMKGLMLLSAVVILKYAVRALSPKARRIVFWVAGLLTIVMLVGIGLARNDLMHLKHLETASAGTSVGSDAQLAALGLTPPPNQKAKAAPPQTTKAELEKSLLNHTTFLAVAYILISLGSAICLVEILEQWPKLGMLKWAREHLAKTQRLRMLQKKALAAGRAGETLAENRLVLMRAAQDLVIRTHLDGLSYTPWWRNTFRLFHIQGEAKLNKSQAYGLRWLKAINCDTAKAEHDACHQALGKLKLVEPDYTKPAADPSKPMAEPKKEVSHA